MSRDAFVREYTEGISAFRKASAHLRIEGKLIEELVVMAGGQKKAPRPKELRATSYSYSLRDDFQKLDMSRGPDDKEEYFHRLLVLGPNQSFGLRKNSRDSQFFLEHEDLPAGYRQQLALAHKTIAEAIYSFNVDSLIKIVESKDFNPTKIDRSANDKTSVVKLVINEKTLDQFPAATKKGAARRFRLTGTVNLNPERAWSIESYQVRKESLDQPGLFVDMIGRIDYENPTGMPKPKRLFLETKHYHGQERKTTFEVSRWDYVDVPPSEFQLKSYGLED